ncbi:hypothetical protein Acsp02_92380 [Actinoplanes sp. NBRC 103695]|nr:hypothetical protein Acsp02_92380 [Actinoplanes sp. NBRC 103695]
MDAGLPGEASPLDEAGPPLTLITGPAGIGRTHVLRALRRAAAGAGRPVLEVRLAPEDRDDPGYLVARVLTGLAPVPARLAAGRGHSMTAEHWAAAFARTLRDRPGLVVLVDDAQWADPRSAAGLLEAMHDLAGSSLRFVAALRTGAEPAPAVAAGFDRLRAAGLVRVAPVRPLAPAAVDALVRDAVRAVPHDSLGVAVRRFGRGRPAAVLAAVEGFRRSGTLAVVDRRAYLTDTAADPQIPAGHDLLSPVRRLAPPARAVARALAVLEPLRAAAPPLIGAVLGLPADLVYEHLGTLRREGVAREGRHGWRIPVPAMALALRAGLGPYERARLAQVAVEALWSGRVHCSDPHFLPDQVAAAGTLVDAGPALALLRERAEAAAVVRPAAAARWWAAAATLSGDPADRVEALLSHAAAELCAGRYAAARIDTHRLLGEHAASLSAAVRQDAELLALAGACGERDVDAIRRTAEGQPWSADGPAPTTVTRAAALTLEDRWAAAARLLARAPLDPPEPDSAAATVFEQVAAVTGRTSALARTGQGGAYRYAERERARAAATDRGARRRAASVVGSSGIHLMAGDLAAAERGIAEAGLPARDLPAPERCLLDWHAGRWDAALDAAEFGMAAGLVAGRHPLPSAVHRAAAEVLLSRGRPARARAVLEATHDTFTALGHLTAVAAAEIEWVLGRADAALRVATNALAKASVRGMAMGRDELWLIVTELAMERGDVGSAWSAAASATTAASALGTEAGAVRAATARMIVARDHTAAVEVVAMARALGRPYELARTLERVVRWTGRTPELLGEAYDLLGDLGAVLHRSRVRQVMREHGRGVPGRVRTLAEGEHLLAVLVADGLSNRELAAATQSSEKSVEGRLTRLFNRTGYRSRVELAAAVLVGDYGPG